MGKCIIKIKDKYFEWSTIVDAPVTYGMSKEELKSYIKSEYGKNGLRKLNERLLRVAKRGHSFQNGYAESLEDVIALNRAGEKETELTIEEIYDKYT